MRRPQSAKNGHKGVWAQMSSDGLSDQENNDLHHQHRKKVKIMKPDFTTNDFARVLPKKIYQDKERLYSEGLQLKQALNETVEQNTRLRTKIAILEKEKDKMNRFIQSSEVGMVSKPASRLNVLPNKNSEKQNGMVRNLKKLIREGKDENEFLKQENAKIKKAIKYTKINELEIQRKTLLQENNRVNTILQQLSQQVNMQGDYEKEIRQLRRYLEEEVENNKQLTEANQNYIEYISSLQEKVKHSEEKMHQKQKKLQRDLAFSKRKLQEEVRVADELRKELRNLKQSANLSDVKKKNQAQPVKGNLRPTSSNPYAKKLNQTSSLSQMPNKKEVQELKERNEKLQKELNQMKSKFSQAQSSNIKQMKKDHQKQVQPIANDFKNKHTDFDQPFIIEEQNEKAERDQPAQSGHRYQQSEQKDQYKAEYEESANAEKYDQDFEESKPTQLSPGKKVDNDIEKYKRDFTEEAEAAEQLYQKQPDSKEAEKPKHKNKKVDGHKKGGYKPSKEFLTQIKQLLTYRMKAQRYPFSELTNDIKVSGETNFEYPDLEAMLKNQPFYLTQKLTEVLLQYVFEQEHPKKTSKSTADNLIKKLRKVIEDFQLVEEAEQEEMLLRIAQMTSTYPSQLQAAFEKVKNGEGTLSKSDLAQMFKKLQLAENYIELIVSELSLCSQDIEHLNYYGFFERFYIESQEGELQNGMNLPIDQEQIESSGGSSRPVKKSVSVKKSAQIQKKEAEIDFDPEEQPQFILDKDQKVQLSMGVKDNYPYDDEQMVSDDGKI